MLMREISLIGRKCIPKYVDASPVEWQVYRSADIGYMEGVEARRRARVFEVVCVVVRRVLP
jgi:hypothetical protein